MLKLDLGAGAVSPEGFTPLGAAHGSGVYPLPYADGSADEIRASHLLEHFAECEVPAVLADWVRVLRPGGMLKVAVPDFGKVAEAYVAGERLNVQGYLMGGQVDERDFHRTLFDRAELRRQLAACGLVLLREWRSEIDDCAALPVSLNLMGTKPHAASLRVAGTVSVPRLGFMDNFFSAFEALPPLGISLRKVTGAFWGPNLQWCIEEALEDPSIEAILTLDYDSIFTRKSVATLLELALCHPEADAIVPVQSNRHRPSPLFTMPGVENKTGSPDELAVIPKSALDGELVPIRTAHFGLTLLRADRLRALPKPWFLGTPAPDGSWGEGKVDEDIHFWRQWEKAGFNLMLAPRVVIGHAELMVRWPNEKMEPIHQTVADWYAGKRPPAEVWK